MSCAKKFGPGAVLINKETTFNNSVALGIVLPAQSVSVGALNREMIDNTELRQNRGKSEQFLGAQSEIAWEIQVVANWGGTDDTTAEGLLFWAAGRNSDGTLAGNSICGRSLQITRFDRDGLLCEVMNGCIVQSVAYSFNANDLCTITFSGVAASKWELNGVSGLNIAWPSASGNITVSAPSGSIFWSSYQMMGTNLPTAKPTGIIAKMYDADGALIGSGSVTNFALGQYNIPQIVVAVDGDETTPQIKQILFDFDHENVAYDELSVVAPSDWTATVGLGYSTVNLAAQTCEITLETGLSFGELTVSQPLPSEIISANNNVSGSFTIYLDDSMVRLTGEKKVEFSIKSRTPSASKILINAQITTAPAYELAPDSAASGDFEFMGYSPVGANSVLVWYNT